jgi:tellurite resistance protein
MGLFKILKGAAMGIGTVAALPIAGPIGVVTFAGGAIAAATGVGVAKMLDEMDEEEKRVQEEELAKLTLKAQKANKIINENKEHTNYIIALSALGIAMANSDGKITEEELEELDEFIGGLASIKYPKYVIEQITTFVENPPTLNEALLLLENLSTKIDYKDVRDVLVIIMEADGMIHKKEKAFLEAFDKKIKMNSLPKKSQQQATKKQITNTTNKIKSQSFEKNGYALFDIEKVFLENGKIVVTGEIIDGSFKINDTISLSSVPLFDISEGKIKARIASINENNAEVFKGDKAKLYLARVTKEQLEDINVIEKGALLNE